MLCKILELWYFWMSSSISIVFVAFFFSKTDIYILDALQSFLVCTLKGRNGMKYSKMVVLMFVGTLVGIQVGVESIDIGLTICV